MGIRRTRVVTGFGLAAALALVGCGGCGSGTPRHDLPAIDVSDILLQKATTAPRPFGVDVFVDATPSMEGFAASPDSTYNSFLEDLEGLFVSAVRNVSNIRFFKFGESIREISRDEFRGSRNPGFYHEPGIFRDTNIELVLSRERTPAPAASATPPRPAAPAAEDGRAGSRVTVVVTDLFQKDQDVNVVVRQIRDGCLALPECSVGILAIPSAFDGMVHDARVPSFPYRSTAAPATFRPFYLLMFGPQEQLLQFADALSANAYIDLDHLLVIGPRIVSSLAVEVQRHPTASGVTPRKATDSPLDSAFNLRKGFTEAKLVSRANVALDPRAFGYVPGRVEVRAFREADGKRLPAGDELVAESVGKAGERLEFELRLRPPTTRGTYVYVVEAVVGGVNGFVVPKWVAGFSSANPTPENEPAKTLNLDRLIERLIAASLLQDHHQPKLVRFRVTIHRL
jgi:hypothetical protein